MVERTGSRDLALRITLRLVALTVLFFSGILSGGALAQVEFSPLSLVGRWSVSARHPDGTLITSHVVFTQNQKFSGHTTANGKPIATYSGTWVISGHTLTWRYATNSALSLAAGAVDTDEIISVDATKLVLRSTLSGRQHDYVRSR